MPKSYIDKRQSSEKNYTWNKWQNVWNQKQNHSTIKLQNTTFKSYIYEFIF